jgi:FAD/FMN-containing dehydrogenase
MRSLASTARRAPSRPLVIQPVHGGYDSARAAWNLTADLRPAGVVDARSAGEVRDAVAFARDLGLRVAPLATGHLATALPPLDDALLVRTDLGREVQIDPAGLRARVSAGAEWEDVVEAAAQHGLAAMHGSSPNVGVVGYLLGGGLSFYARRHGLASDHVLAVELVTADGVLRRVDRDNEPDLFWALRGGGGNFGVVTAIEVGLLPYAEVFSGATFWPAAQAAEVLQAWRAWTETVPDTVTTSARILRLPPLPEIPEFLRGGPVLAIDGVVAPECDDPEALLAAWRSIGRPLADTWAAGPPEQVLRMHGDPEPPMPGLSGHALLGALDEAGIERFLGAAGEDSGCSLVVAELRQLGGALAAPRPGAGAGAHLDGAFLLFGVGVPVPPEAGAHVAADLASLQDAMAPYDTGRVYLNYHERGGSARTSFTPETYARLAEVRAAYDPAELFVASHRIAPAREG